MPVVARRRLIARSGACGEILSGFETKNRYAVQDLSGNLVYQAAEEDGSMLLRMFLKALRCSRSS